MTGSSPSGRATEDVAEEWERLRRVRTLPVSNALIDATARTHGRSVVARNVKDFADTGVAVINPSESPA
jgi:toxin FitB